MAKTTGLASISVGSGDVYKIDPRKLNVREGWNARDWSLQENIDHVEELAGSIAAIGVKEPLTVYWEDGKAWIDNGECRHRAIMLCIERGVPIKTVKCIPADRYANEADRRFNRYIANTGKPFNQLETASDWKWFLDQGWSQEDISKKAGLSQGRVSQILSLLTMPTSVKKMVANGEIAPSLAMQVVREEGVDAEKVLKAGLKTAKSEGHKKVKGKHVGKAGVKEIVTDAFEYSEVDDSASDFCVITMPIKRWEIIKELLKL